MKNKNQKTIFTIIGVIAVLAGLLWLGRCASVSDGNTPSSRFTEGVIKAADASSYDFGTISMAGGDVSQSFRIKNTGEEPAAIRKIYTSCMCTTATLKTAAGAKGPFGMPGHGIVPAINQRLEAGEEAEVVVVFDPAAHGPAGVGPITRAVYLEESSGSTLELMISAKVIP